jgi:peptidoglycan hydrolase-like protein with peptidoglycan-binding domain
VQARAPTLTPIRVGAATVALAAIALVLAAPAAADPLSAGSQTSLRPRTVEAVQERLVELGFLPPGAVDGLFGGRTQAAVIAFQKWTGLARDGIPGPITQLELQFAKRPTPRTKRPGTRVEILLDRQLLLLIRRNRVERVVHVSTGRPGFRTPKGDYSVLRKRRRSWSVPYEVWLPWASYFVGGFAIHQSANVPVRPASHGCVRVTRYDARWLFRQMPVGTRVTVLRRS